MVLTYREKEWDQMINLLQCGVSGLPLPPALFVTGPPESGKNLLVSTVLKELHAQGKISTYAKVSCIPATIHIREVFDEILIEVRKNLGITDCGNRSSVTCLSDLVEELSDTLKTSSATESKGCIIALSDAEKLRRADPLIVPGLLKLAELSGLNICVVFISRILWSKWSIDHWATSWMMTISLSPYSKYEMIHLITSSTKNFPHDKKLDDAQNFFESFSEVIYGNFSAVCRTLSKFLRQAQLLLPVYAKPVIEGQVDPDNVRALFRHAEPYIKQCIAEVNLNEGGLKMELKGSQKQQGLSVNLARPSRLNVELPFFSKFLLIAAFLASYNPAKSDKRFFVVNSGRIKKRKNPVAIASHKRSSQLLGPKPFPLDRLLAIFHAIVDQKAPPRSKILNQVTSLVSLQLLTQIGSSDIDSIEIPKYKCNVGLDFIRLVSRNVQFEVHKYLYDADF